MDKNIICPYCKSKKLQVIGGNIETTYKGFKSWTEYKCLENEGHVFKTVKFNKFNVDDK